ncbi:MAG: DUF4386 family protein [Promethearchaeota archaeon]|jgi:hypothetical protein
MGLSGFFFLFIIITNITSGLFGYKTFGDVDLDAKLQEINNYPKKFKISVVLILTEHISIISLAVTLFIAFSPYNMILGIIWVVSRTGEALIQIYDKKNYWELLNIGIKYSGTSGVERDGLVELGDSILKTKDSIFTFAQILFSIGTFAYSIGWFGIVASILYGFGNGIFRIKPNFKVLWNIGGLLILLFELVLGGWLLFFSHI